MPGPLDVAIGAAILLLLILVRNEISVRRHAR
jgi:hypothetical protein